MSRENVRQLLIAMFLVLGVALSFVWGCSHKEQEPSEYQFIVTDDSMSVYDGTRFVGTVELQGQLDSLITVDNQ